MFTGKTKRVVHYLLLGILVYLFFFSAFALYHAYANDEILDPKGCHIGLWVQHGQATLWAALSLTFIIICLHNLRFWPDRLYSESNIKLLSARAPPAFPPIHSFVS
jgi:hypothetical protein